MRRTIVTVTWLLVAASRAPSDAAPKCLRAEVTNEQGGFRRFWFDDAGRLVRNEDRDNAGVVLSDVKLAWTTAGWTETRANGAGKLQATTTGELGPHGELVKWVMGTRVVVLVWDGTFGHAKPRPAYETAYLGSVDFWSSLDTADQHLFARSGKPFAFTGVVAIDDGGRQRTVTYQAGKRVKETTVREGQPIEITYAWKGDDLIGIAHGDGHRVVITSKRGQIQGTKAFDADGKLQVQKTIEYAGAVPKLVVSRYFEGGKEAYTSKLAITRCE